MRGREDGFVGVGRPHAVAALDLVGVRAGLARQHAGVGAQADHLVAQPAVLELVEQSLRGGDERPRLDRRLRVDGGGQLGRAEVGVDDPFDVPAELEPQPEVALRGGLGHVVSVRRSGLRRRGGPRSSVDGRLRGTRCISCRFPPLLGLHCATQPRDRP